MTLRSRTLGGLLGVHAGDSLGATMEFLSWEYISQQPPHRDITGGGHFSWPAGHATDDTDLTRAVLLAYRDFFSSSNPSDEKKDVVKASATHMLNWYHGTWPSRTPGSRPVDIGGATHTGLRNFDLAAQRGITTYRGAGQGSAGNGSLMRCIPTGLFQSDRTKLVGESKAISAVTHDDFHCVLACVGYNVLVRELVEGKTPGEALTEAVKVVEEEGRRSASNGDGGSAKKDKDPLLELAAKRTAAAMEAGRDLITIADLANNGPKEAVNGKKVLPFKGQGYVLESLSIAVAALFDTRSLEDVLVDVVRIGKDTDTNGAIAGGLLGVRDGVEAIPQRWRDKLQFAQEFTEIVDEVLSGH